MALLSRIWCWRARMRNAVIVPTRWDSPSHFHTTLYPARARRWTCNAISNWSDGNLTKRFFTCSSQPPLVLSNPPSLKVVISSNVKYKNTIGSHCQGGSETAEFHKKLRNTNWQPLQPSFLHFVGTFEQQPWFTLGRSLPLKIDSFFSFCIQVLTRFISATYFLITLSEAVAWELGKESSFPKNLRSESGDWKGN